MKCGILEQKRDIDVKKYIYSEIQLSLECSEKQSANTDFLVLRNILWVLWDGIMRPWVWLAGILCFIF
jgi:hypothetical protein